jgi:hypothetical protein
MAQFLAAMVMPRSRSRSMLSMSRSAVSWPAPKHTGLAEKGVDESGFPMINMGDNGNIAQGAVYGIFLHSATLPPNCEHGIVGSGPSGAEDDTGVGTDRITADFDAI